MRARRSSSIYRRLGGCALLMPAAGLVAGSTDAAAQGITRPAAAASNEIFIDGDAPEGECSGDGSDAAPFRSLACAFDAGAIRPGTTLTIRDADVPYEGVDSQLHSLPSGAQDAPIIIRPAPGHAPIFDGPIVLVGLSHWELHGLVFDGSTGDAPVGDAIRFNGSGTDDVTGVRVEGVTVRSWPGRAIVLRGTDSSQIIGGVVTGNRIDAARDVGIWVEDAVGAQVTHNEISDLVCRTIAFTVCDDCGPGQCAECGDCLDTPVEMCSATTDYDRGHQSGVRVLGDSSDALIRGNYLHDFLDDDCGAEGTRTAAVFITGADARQGTIEHNLIERIAPQNPDNGYGILMFQSAPEWIVQRNVLSDIGRCALCEGDDLFYGSQQARWLHNTVDGVTGAGIDVRWAVDAQFEGNLVVDAAGGAVRVWDEGIAQAPSFEYNLYWSAADDVAGQWGDAQASLDLGSWQAACGCDQLSVWGDPGLPSAPLDFTPAPDGPAIDLVPAKVAEHNGASFDAGAIEAPLLVEASILSGLPETIRLMFQNRQYDGFVGVAGCVGLTVESERDQHPLVDCTTEADEVLLHLSERIRGTDPITVRYAGGTISTSPPAGVPIGAVLRPFEIEVQNNAPLPEDPTGGTGEGETGPGEGGLLDEGGPSGDGPDGSEGCGCKTTASTSPLHLAWPLMLLLGAARRRRHGDRLRLAGSPR